MRLEPGTMTSAIFNEFTGASGPSRVELADRLLAAPATLVINVEDEVLAEVVRGPTFLFTPASVTVRQVRFDSEGQVVCAKRVTLTSSSGLLVKRNASLVDVAREDLRSKIPGAF